MMIRMGEEQAQLSPLELQDPANPSGSSTVMDKVQRTYPDDAVLQKLIQAVQQGHRRIPKELLDKKLRIELARCRIHEGLLYFNNRLYIPEGEVRTEIIQQVHESYCGGHSGKHGTYQKLSQWYFWPKMTDTIERFVCNCLTCKRTKAYREGKHGLLHPLPIPEKYWSSISMDYITKLPPSTAKNGITYENILVIVDRLSKKKKFIAVQDLTVETLVQAYIEYVWREEGYPDDIISDRGRQFVSHFWTRLCDRLGTKPKLSTAYHPETDGQTENANAYLKQYLRAYCNYNQDNWADLLPMAEFEANSTVSATTGVAPFVATKGYVPRMGLEPARPLSNRLTTPARNEIARADEFAKKLSDLREFLKASIAWAQAKQAEYANQNRLPAPVFQKDDLVMLDTRNIKTTRPNRSLDYPNRGPFPIIEVIDHLAYRVQLPPELSRLHNVFHPWLLHRYENNPLPGQQLDIEEPAELEPEEVDYEVEAILDSRMDMTQRDPGRRGRPRGVLQYLIKWKDYKEGEDNPSWEPYTIVDAPDLIAQFHRDHPEKPAPPLTR
jgi:transposase InsO family protein